MVTTKMNWSGPPCAALPTSIPRPIHSVRHYSIQVVNKSLLSSPNQFGQTKTILDQPKVFGSHRRTRQLCISSTIFNQMKIRIPVKDCHRLGIGCRDVGVSKGVADFARHITTTAPLPRFLDDAASLEWYYVIWNAKWPF